MVRCSAAMDRRSFLGVVAVSLGSGLAGCGSGTGGGNGDGGTRSASTSPGGPSIASPAFDAGGSIPTRLTCDGADVSPALTVADVPSNATELALTVDDPDAPGGTFTHWLLWGVPPGTGTIPEAVPRGETVATLDGARQGTNDAGVVGYSGPCPPTEDGPHRYRFRLFALGEPLSLDAGADRAAFDDALAGMRRSAATLRGTYER